MTRETLWGASAGLLTENNSQNPTQEKGTTVPVLFVRGFGLLEGVIRRAD